MNQSAAEILREYGPFPGIDRIHGVTYDGHQVWFASDDQLNAFDPETGEIVRTLSIPARAGTAFDGKHLFQIGKGRIKKLDPNTGEILSEIPAPSEDDNSGMAWAEGSLWIGQPDAHKIFQVDPETGTILRTIESDRFVTGVTWIDGGLWHGTWEDNKASEVRRIDPRNGQVLETLTMPGCLTVSGLESNGRDRFFCGGGSSGMVRAIRKPK